MPEVTEQPAKPIRTCRRRWLTALWATGILLVFGLGWLAATVVVPALGGRGAGRLPENAPSPVPPPPSDPGIAGLTPIECEAVAESSDGGLTVWNYNAGGGGTMPDIINTLRWYDGDRRRDWIMESYHGGLGWVENVATFRTSKATVYVTVAEKKLTSCGYVTLLDAFRIKKGMPTLEAVPGFFPSMPGTAKDGSSVDWEYYRERGMDVFPRPVEVRLDEERQRLKVWLFPEARIGLPQMPDNVKRQEFVLALEKGKLVCQGFDAADRETIEAITGLALPAKIPGKEPPK